MAGDTITMTPAQFQSAPDVSASASSPQSGSDTITLSPSQVSALPTAQANAAPTATISAAPTADQKAQQFASDHPYLTAAMGGGSPAGGVLTMPMVKGLIALHDKLTDMEDLTQEGQQAHPIQAEIGHLANRIEGLLTGNPQHPEDAIGTGNYGMLTNPVTATIMPGSSGAPAITDLAETGANLATKSFNSVKGLMSLGTADEAEQAPGVIQNIKTVAKNPRAIISDEAAKGLAQPATQSAVRSAASDIAQGAEVANSAAQSTARTVADVADNVYGKSKGLYAQIDQATGGKFAGNQRLLDNVQRELRMASSDEEVAKLETQRTTLLQNQDKLFDQAAANGVSKDTVAAAKASYRQSQALYRLDNAVVQSTKGVPPEIATEGSIPESIDPKQLSNRVNKMYRSGDLTAAFGGNDQAAASFVNKVSQAAHSQQGILDTVKLARWLTPFALGGTAAYEGGKLAGVLFGK